MPGAFPFIISAVTTKGRPHAVLARPVPRALPVANWLATPLERARGFIVSGYLPWVVIAVAVGLRVGRYLHDRSLWLDESQLALNIMSHSYGELFGKLDFAQGAPVGFLLLEKLTISALGDSERAFRLFPLLAGLASVFVFWRVALRFAGREAGLLAMAFFAVLGSLIFYSAETKPYSFDVLTALVLLWLFDRAFTSGRFRDWAVFALVGIAAPWFSHPSVFVLTATGTLLLLPAVLRRNWRLVALNCLAIAAWTVSCVAAASASLFGANTSCRRPLPNVGRLTRSPGEVNSTCSTRSRMCSSSDVDPVRPRASTRYVTGSSTATPA